MFNGKCPICGTEGRLWLKAPDIFVCPNCEAIFSNFGLLFEAERKNLDYCS